ncbi:MAG: radical SAM protein [Desulfovibrionaceae bacterium]|nr:radical SAM protein [Desulfovibrionaceae bacterium]
MVPNLVLADSQGQIFDHPDLLMLCRRGQEWGLPKPHELLPLPKESELFLLPERQAVGLNPHTGVPEIVEDGFAVAAFVAPGHTLSAHPVYTQEANAQILPLFAYGAVGFANDRFYVAAQKVDNDQRQCFANIARSKIATKARQLQKNYPRNRLIAHIINNCVARYDCPAARNFALGRFEAPIPTSTSCNARCLGCISKQDAESQIKTTPQCRLTFTPTAQEICEVMRIHAERERERPIFSFGQGCEGDPLTQAGLLTEAISLYRQKSGHGTINCNTNASRPNVIPDLAQAGLTSIRVSLNSAQEHYYTRYYRCQNYTFADVVTSIRVAREHNLFVSLNLLFFPGLTDTEAELQALAKLVGENGVSMIQWRNLNIDPVWYYQTMTQDDEHLPTSSLSMGLTTFLKRLKTMCPWLIYGYFNPYLGDVAELTAPMPYTWVNPEKAAPGISPQVLTKTGISPNF